MNVYQSDKLIDVTEATKTEVLQILLTVTINGIESDPRLRRMVKADDGYELTFSFKHEGWAEEAIRKINDEVESPSRSPRYEPGATVRPSEKGLNAYSWLTPRDRFTVRSASWNERYGRYEYEIAGLNVDLEDDAIIRA